MSNPNRQFVTPLITDGDISTSFESNPVNLSECAGYAMEVTSNGSGDAEGEFIVMASVGGTKWATIVSINVADGEATTLLNVENPRYIFLKVVYTASAGSGTLNVLMTGINP